MARCNSCIGSGKIMGLGMISTECWYCDGNGRIEVKDPIDLDEVKKTSGYKKAISKIKSANKDLTQEKAEKIFEDEFSQLQNDSIKM